MTLRASVGFSLNSDSLGDVYEDVLSTVSRSDVAVTLRPREVFTHARKHGTRASTNSPADTQRRDTFTCAERSCDRVSVNPANEELARFSRLRTNTLYNVLG